MRTARFIHIILFLIFFLFLKNEALSWTEGTHEKFSQYASENSVLRECNDETDQNCDYLKSLGFEKGLSQELTWYKIKNIEDWLAEGANLEDSATNMEYICGNARSYNHFHNPLKPWDSAGLNDIILNLCPPPLIPPTRNAIGESSLLWMQNGTSQEDFREGDWSWQKIRQVYYWALISTTDSLRQVNFAQTFRGLGHQMHLIQDAAQPDHVRNDAHPEDTLGFTRGIGFEKWTGKRFFNLQALQNFVQALPNFSPDPPNLINYFPNVTLNVSYNNLVPITQFLDAEQYNGNNPSTSLSQGIAEYTNANFFSDATTFAAEIYSSDHRHYFLYPKKASTNLQELIDKNILPETIIAEDGVEDVTLYVKKERDGEQVDHFLKPMYTTTKRWDIIGGGYVYELDFYRDELCHEDYASKLVPRAVGYSAGLLNYFFRGNIEITLPDNGIYAQTDNATTGFTKITLLAKNITSGNEEMTDGSIELVVRYKPAQADPFQSGLVGVDEEFTYRVVPELNNTRAIPRDTSVELTFDLGQSTIIPINATNVYLQVVYKGRLGNEDGAIAVGFKDISEPTPIDVFNNMDKICINGSWYTAGSAEAIAQVDANQDGRAYGVNEWDVYAHDLQNIYARFTRADDPQYASPTVNNYAVSNLSAGSFTRALYILTDYQYGYSFYKTQVPTDSNDWWGHVPDAALHSGTSIKRQTDYVEDSGACGGIPACYIDSYPVFYHFRNIDMWWGGGVIFTNEPYPSGSQCDNGLL